MNSNEAKEFDPILVAGVAHYEWIHPFVDGNGRTGRALATLILYLRGFDTKQFFCIDDYYDSDRPAYYRALQSVDQRNLDLTDWLAGWNRIGSYKVIGGRESDILCSGLT